MNNEMLGSIREVFIGNEYHWEPAKRNASVWCRVINITWNGEEFWTETVQIDRHGVDIQGSKCKNELSRFVEATTFNQHNT